MPRVGMLTSGGDCPGLNAAIRAATRRLIDKYDAEVLGIRNGFTGLIDGDIEPISLYSVSGILPKGGTILGTSRIDPYDGADNLESIRNNLERNEIDSLIVIGDWYALNSAHKLIKDGIQLVFIPGTIDNDIAGTELTFGFDTAVSIATEAIDRLHSTADSHHRIMVVEVMGRESGWIATQAGLAGGADIILIPEVEFSLDKIGEILKKRHKKRNFSIVVVAEGLKPSAAESQSQSTEDQQKLPPYVGGFIGKALQERTGMDMRFAVLGHIQRGGTPTVADRVLASQFGVQAADCVANERFGLMACIKGHAITSIPIEDVVGKVKKVDPELYEIASVFFG